MLVTFLVLKSSREVNAGTSTSVAIPEKAECGVEGVFAYTRCCDTVAAIVRMVGYDAINGSMVLNHKPAGVSGLADVVNGE